MDSSRPQPASLRQVAPYGSWRSPISANRVARGGVRLGEVQTWGDEMGWLESRPAEAGRSVVVRRDAGGAIVDLTPKGWNVRTRVHEYGGGAWVARDRTLWFARFSDQRLYRQHADGAPEPLTREPENPAGLRYADLELSPDGRWLFCVRESHAPGREARNEIVRIPAEGEGPVRVVSPEHDFVSTPRLSPDGRSLAFISWEHPRMPWDGTELWIVDLSDADRVGTPERLAGGESESIFQPAWSPDGALHFVSDRSGWWNLYRCQSGGDVALAPAAAEFGRPQWAFASATYAFLADGRIVCVWIAEGRDHLGVLEPGRSEPREVATPLSAFGRPAPLGSGSRVALTAASPIAAGAVVVIDLETGEVEEIRCGQDRPLERAFISVPESIEFPTSGERSAHALFYPPASPDFRGPPGEGPPLLVISHGGPTGAASSAQNVAIQFWTSRGIAVVDVDYGGSTGYGRAYRERLRGQWGLVDTWDCIAAARFLVAQGRVDGERLAIRGGSAGGFTTLCALTFHDVFRAGASYYGVADLEALARDTHKFESRYLDSLVGPYPAARERYRERSPIHFPERLSCPLLLLQGEEDEIVPPAQAEVMVAALRERAVPYAYLLFRGEQHGFRRAENIVRALEAELSFYGQILGFEPADAIEPLRIVDEARNLLAPDAATRS